MKLSARMPIPLQLKTKHSDGETALLGTVITKLAVA